jgi:hypothetical protein
VNALPKWVTEHRWEEEPEPVEPPYNDGYINARDLKEEPRRTREEEMEIIRKRGIKLVLPEDWGK